MDDRLARLSNTSAEFTTLMVLSPLVIGMRMTRFWLTAGRPTSHDRREADRMVLEKVSAAGESIIAMQTALGSALLSASLAALAGKARTVDDADAILSAGLRPFSRRVVANNRRLFPDG